MAVIRCLKEERDWLVLNLVLSEVPSVLQNKGMLTRYHRYLTFCAHMLHICESVLWTGSVPLQTDPDPTPDRGIFVSGLQDDK
jgi:hypothetical protein